jgi:predicted phage terminase large subunit-like protein
MYIDGGFRAKIESPKTKKYILERFHAEQFNTVHGITKAIWGSAFVQELRLLPAARGVAFKAVNERGDKFTRALAWAARAEEGRVFLIRGGWNDALIAEMLKFTGQGKEEDDQIDAISVSNELATKKSGKLHGF